MQLCGALLLLLWATRVTGRALQPEVDLPFQDNEYYNTPEKIKDLQLEDELRLLTPQLPYDSFDDLTDVDQQREQPNEEEGREVAVIVTTLLPNLLTEEETRVNEPTERAPAEPTQENSSASIAITSDSLITNWPENIDTVTTPSPTKVNRLLEENNTSEEEQLMTVKQKRKDDEDNSEEVFLTIDNESGEDSKDTTFEVETLTHKDRLSNPVIKDENNHNNGISSALPESHNNSDTRQRLMEVLQQSGLYTRTVRKANRHPPYDEDFLEFMIKLSENPRSWARIQEILEQPDSKNPFDPKHNPYKPMGIQPIAKHESKLTKAEKALSQFPLPYHENSVLEKQAPQGVKPSLLQDKSASLLSRPHQEDRGQAANKIHMHWEKSHLKPQEKFHQQLLLDKIGNSAYKNSPSKSNVYGVRPVGRDPALVDNIRPAKLHVPYANLDPFQAQKQTKAPYSYGGPISAITIDVPTANNMRSNNYPGTNPKQAYIAVSVYKPSKDGNNYRSKGIINKPNDLSYRYHNALRPSSFNDNRDLGIEKPVTYIGTSAADRMQINERLSHSRSKSALQHLKNKEKMSDHMYNKGKNKNRTRFGKQSRRKQQKNRNKNRTKTTMDEIEAQLVALSRMEQRLKQHMQEKEKLRQQMRLTHHIRPPRDAHFIPSYM